MKEPMENRFWLDGRVAIITGGSTGLGYQIALGLSHAGADVLVTSRSAQRAEKAAAAIADRTGGFAAGLAMDQRHPASVAAMASKAYDSRGHVDILVNNAGGGAGDSDGDFLTRDLDTMADMIASNLTGVLYCCQAVGRYMADQGYGKIVNLGSVAGLVGRDRTIYRKNHRNPQPVEYAAAKGGVIALGRDMAAYFAPLGVRVNTLSPGIFNKGELSQGFDRDSRTKIPLGRTGRPEEDIAAAALFLCAPASDYMTGHNLVVDGGFSIYK